MFYKLRDFEFKNKKILIRVDFDVPIENNKITDDSRIKTAIPTIDFVLKKGAEQAILMSHLGRPEGKVVETLRLNLVAKRLEELIKKQVKKLDACIDIAVPDDRIVLLENLRFDKREESNDLEFAKKLARFGDVYVNEAFAVSHRNHASVSAITTLLPSCAGMLLEKELSTIESITKNPERPFMILIGGAKSDKITVIKNLIELVDRLLLSGMIANTFLKAQGINIGQSKYDEHGVAFAKELLGNSRLRDKIALPSDAVVAGSFNENAQSKNVDITNIGNNIIMDVGEETIKEYKKTLKNAKTVVWAGAPGVFEWKSFSKGSEEIGIFLSKLKAKTIIGGGDTGAALERFGLTKKMTFISTGGGAFLEALSGNALPAVQALERAYGRLKK